MSSGLQLWVGAGRNGYIRTLMRLKPCATPHENCCLGKLGHLMCQGLCASVPAAPAHSHSVGTVVMVSRADTYAGHPL